MTVMIGLGNCKGGVGTSTLACNLAALLRAMGHTVAIAESVPAGAVLAWAEARARRAGRQLNTSRLDIGAYYVDSYADLRIAPQLVGYDYLMLDYSHIRRDITQAMRVVDHWVCSMRPNDWPGTLQAYERWCDLRRRGSVAAMNFSAVLSLVPSAEDVEEDLADDVEDNQGDHQEDEPTVDLDQWRSLATGDFARHLLAVEEPSLHLLDAAIGYQPTACDMADGTDVFGLKTEESLAAARDVVTVWTEAVRSWSDGVGSEVPPLPLGPGPRPGQHRIETLGRYWRS